MKSRIYLSLFLILVFCSLVQVRVNAGNLDSLISELQAAKEDTNKVILLCKIGTDYFDKNPATGIDYGKQALHLATELNYEYGIVKSNNVIARCYAIRADFPSSLRYYKDALLMARKVKNPVFIGTLHTALGAVYIEKKDYDASLEQLMQAKETYEQAGLSIASSLANNLGFLYNAKKNYPEALKWYLEGIAIEERSDKQSPELAKLYGNAGMQYVKTKDYANGMKFMFRALALQEQNGDDNGVAITTCDIGSAYLSAAAESKVPLPDTMSSKNANLTKAVLYLSRSEQLCAKLGMQSQEEHVYIGLSKAYGLRNDFYKSKIYLEKYISVHDTLRDFEREKEFARVEAAYIFQKHADSLNNLAALKDEELHQERLERNGGVLVAALAGIISFLLVNRQKTKHKQRRELAEKEVEYTRARARQQLDAFTQSIQEKNALIAQFAEELERYQSLPCSNELPERDKTQELLNAVILTEEQWADFQVLFEQVHAGYINRVNEKFPGLTAAELRFVLLTRLGMSNKEMAAMLGVGYEAVRVVKHRLLKKIHLPDGQSLEEATVTI